MKVLPVAAIGAALATVCFGQGQGKINPPKPGWNLFSKDQDIQLGKEAAAQVEKQYVVVNDPEVTAYLNALGQKLAKSKYAGDFPFTFRLVADESINAFALPGGPMFVHTGLIKAADNEGQLMGVLAHEMSHVALRHGTHQATTANALQIVPALAGAIAGNGMLGQLAQMGMGLGENSLMLKFSRTAETQADYNGGLMMASVGYSPIEMAHFFEKLEAQSGKQNVISRMMSDHPSPGNRVKSSEDLAKLLPAQNYNNDNTAFNKEKALVMAMKIQPKPAQAAGAAPAAPAKISDLRPAAQLRAFDGNAHNFQYPTNWEVFGDASTPSVTVAPRGGIGQAQGGQTLIAYGIMQSYFQHANTNGDLKTDNDALIQGMLQGDPKMKVLGSQNLTVDGKPALATQIESTSPFQGETEVDVVVSVERPEGLFYLVLVAPKSEWSSAQPIYQRVVASVKFNN